MAAPRRPSRRWIRQATPVLLLAASTAVALGVAEVGLRLVNPQIFPVIPRGLFTDRPDGLRVLTPGFEGVISRAEFHAPVGISDFGVRGPGPGVRGENTLRILALGDSQTFGFGVMDHETYAVYLQELLAARYPDRHVEVINAGVPGYGTVDEVIWLRERGAEVDPDLILAQFLSVNDFKINRDSPLVPRVLGEDHDRLPAAGVPSTEEHAPGSRPTVARGSTPAGAQRESLASRAIGAVHGLKRRSHVATLLSEAGSYIGMRVGLLGGVAAMWGEDFTPEDAELTRRLLVLLAREAQAMEVPVVLLYTTGKAHVIAGDGAPLPSVAVMAGAAEEAGVPWVDMTQELRARDDRQELYFVRDGHWTAAGHRAVAEVLANRLEELGVLP